jgi:hypothetical protein
VGPSQQREGEGEEKSGGTWAGLREKKWAKLVGEFLIDSNKIQMEIV